MKTSKSRAQVPLSKKDINFLTFLDQSYAPGSTMRLAERSKLRMIIDFFEVLSKLIGAAYKLLAKKKIDVGATALDNIARAISGEFPDLSIDFSKVSILCGELAAPCGTMHHMPGSVKLNFSWGTCIQCNSNRSDQLMVMIYRPATREYWFEPTLGVTREDGFCTIDVPQSFGGAEIHVWLAYRSADQTVYSNSSYMGKVLIP